VYPQLTDVPSDLRVNGARHASRESLPPSKPFRPLMVRTIGARGSPPPSTLPYTFYAWPSTRGEHNVRMSTVPDRRSSALSPSAPQHRRSGRASRLPIQIESALGFRHGAVAAEATKRRSLRLRPVPAGSVQQPVPVALAGLSALTWVRSDPHNARRSHMAFACWCSAGR
jgi:hypothetical protein